jgi:tetratricopeptide (TPR) repeat protein
VNPPISSALCEPNDGGRRSVNALILNISHPTKQAASALLFFLIVLLLVYLPSFSGVWIYDDEPNILMNENIHLEQIDITSLKKALYFKSQDPHSAERVRRPLAYLSFALNWYVGKNQVFGYHAVNFFIHLATTLFVYLFIKNSLMLPIVDNRYHDLAHLTAFLSALIWAIHPIHVTAVTYIVQRMTSLAGLFTIMSLYGYLKARNAKSRVGMIGCFAVCGLCALCAFASKENSVMLPASLFFYEIIMIRGVAHTDLKKIVRWGLPALAIMILVGLLYINPTSLLDGYANRPYTPVERVMTQSRVVWAYLKMLFYPLLSELTLVHDVEVSTSLLSPWSTLPSIILAGMSFFTALFWLSRKQPLVAYAIVFFFVNHAIEGSIVCLELIYEHRNYLPSMMLFVIPATLFLNALKYFSYHRKLQMLYIVSGAVILASIGHSSYAYSNLFRHGLIFWRDNAKKSPHLSVVLNNYGLELMKQGSYEEALQTLQRSIALDRYFNLSQKGVTYHNLGIYYETIENDYKRALPYLKRATDINPHSKQSWLSYSMCHLIAGNAEKAEALIKDALEKWPDNPDFLLGMSKIQLFTGNADAALTYARQTRAAAAGAVGPLAIFGDVYRLKGNLKKAVFFWQAYRRERPNSVVAALVLLELYHQTGNDDMLSAVVSNLIAEKGDHAWDGWLQAQLTHEKHFSAVIYAPQPEYILSVIRYTLGIELEKTKKGR